jgi:GNAT superfamily N-acetyltransferase
MIHADLALARRLETLICAELRTLGTVGRAALPGAGATWAEVAGGVALWLGPGSPVNVAVGLGMDGPVSDADLDRVEEFYFSRGAESIVTLCPLADESLWDGLGRRGYRVTEFENVLALELGGGGAEAPRRASAAEPEPAAAAPPAPAAPPDSAEPPAPAAPPGVVVRTCTGEERALWGRMVARGFADHAPPGQPQLDVGAVMAARDDAVLVMAWVGGEPAATGAMVIDGGVGWLMGDTTLPPYRRRGIQQALLRYRLDLAQEAGCDLAVAETAPGSGSQRNLERLGFRVVFTHVELVRPPM